MTIPYMSYHQVSSSHDTMAAAPNKFRTYALTGSFAAITATGAWYGAGLKTRQEYSQVRMLLMAVERDHRLTMRV